MQKRLLFSIPLLLLLSMSLVCIFINVSPVYANPDTTSITCQVSASSDDCSKEYYSGAWNFSLLYHVGSVGWQEPVLHAMGVGLRFRNIMIPRNSVIVNAYLNVSSGSDRSEVDVRSRIRGEASDNASAFSTLVDYDARPRTTAVVTYDNIPAWLTDVWYQTSNITSIVQEIVNRAGWEQRNSLVIFWDDNENRSATVLNTRRLLRMYDYGSAYAPKLTVEFISSTKVQVINPYTGTNTFVLYNPPIGYQFTANITVVNVTKLYFWQIEAYFNPNHLNVINLTLPSDHVLHEHGIHGYGPVINNTAGYVQYYVFYSPADSYNFTGSGRLCQILFNVTGTFTSTTISIDNAQTFLINVYGDDIPNVKVNGIVTIPVFGDRIGCLVLQEWNGTSWNYNNDFYSFDGTNIIENETWYDEGTPHKYISGQEWWRVNESQPVAFIVFVLINQSLTTYGEADDNTRVYINITGGGIANPQLMNWIDTGVTTNFYAVGYRYVWNVTGHPKASLTYNVAIKYEVKYLDTWHHVETWIGNLPLSIMYFIRMTFTFTALVALLLAPSIAVLGAKQKNKYLIVGVLVMYTLAFLLIALVINTTNV